MTQQPLRSATTLQCQLVSSYYSVAWPGAKSMLPRQHLLPQSTSVCCVSPECGCMPPRSVYVLLLLGHLLLGAAGALA
jgi:hypothetical protein